MKRIERLAAEGADRVVLASLRSRRSFMSWCSHAFLSLCIALVLIGGVGFVILRGGVNSELLRDEAQKSLSGVLGKDASATIGSAGLSLDQNSLVAMEARDVSIIDPKQGIEIRNIKSVRLGLAPLPLLTGKVRVAELEIDGASFDLPEQEGAGFWKSLPYDKRGYIDFDAVSEELFSTMRRNLELLRNQNTHAIGLLNTTIRFKTGDTQQSIEVQKLRLVESSGKISVAGVPFGRTRRSQLMAALIVRDRKTIWMHSRSRSAICRLIWDRRKRLRRLSMVIALILRIST